MTQDGQAALAAGIAAYDARDFPVAAEHFRTALNAGADPVKAWTNLAVVLRNMDKLEAAVGCAARALALDPENAEGWGVLGRAKLQLGLNHDAVSALRQAVAVDPKTPLYWHNLGIAAQRAGQLEDALSAFRAGLALKPGDPRFQFQCATTLLQLERFEEAWPLFESRFDFGELTHRGHEAKPRWRGDPLSGRRLLIYAEQGLGDMIQFSRFLPDVIERAQGEVAIEVQPNLVRLFAANFPDARAFGVEEDTPEFDVGLPIGSAAMLVGGVPETGLDVDGSYLSWRHGGRKKHRARPRVGLVWRGKPNPWIRSCPFHHILGLAEASNVDFVSLQRGGGEEIEEAGAQQLFEDATQGAQDFADDAETAADLDLVISIDTSTCHFAGALGLPVWTLLPGFTDWRFPPEGNRTRWYPTMRLFRQQRPGDWASTIAEVKEALEGFACNNAKSGS